MATSRSATTIGGSKVRIKVTAAGKPMKTVPVSSSGGSGLVNPQGRPAIQGSRRIAR